MGINPNDLIEQWAEVQGTDGIYEVSNLGHVRNSETGLMLSPRPTANGYLRVHISLGGRNRKDVYIHRLVAEAFCKHRKGCDVINHIDNNPQNNRFDNLEWTDQRGNVMHAMKQGRVTKFPNAKKVSFTKNGVETVFRSTHEAAEVTGKDHKTIMYYCKNSIRTFMGGNWRFKEAV